MIESAGDRCRWFTGSTTDLGFCNAPAKAVAHMHIDTPVCLRHVRSANTRGFNVTFPDDSKEPDQ